MRVFTAKTLAILGAAVSVLLTLGLLAAWQALHTVQGQLDDVSAALATAGRNLDACRATLWTPSTPGRFDMLRSPSTAPPLARSGADPHV